MLKKIKVNLTPLCAAMLRAIALMGVQWLWCFPDKVRITFDVSRFLVISFHLHKQHIFLPAFHCE